jgi:hypothetical protein
MSIFLTLDDLRLATTQVLEAGDILTQSNAAAIYLPSLTATAKKLDAAAAAGGAPPISDADLGETDRWHDGYAKALWHLTEAYLSLPVIDPDVLSAVERIRATLVPGADVWTATYPSEAQRAEDKKPQLKALADDFALVPVAGGKDAGYWGSEHIKAGIKLGTELATNAAATATAQKLSDAPQIRAQLLKSLGDFRTALSAEAENKPALAPVVTGAFALLDKLIVDRSAAARAAAKRKGKDAAPTAPVATDAPATPTDS